MYKIYTEKINREKRAVRHRVFIMKPGMIILLIIVLGNILVSHAQQVNIVQQKISVGNLIKEVRRQTGFNILLPADKISPNKIVNANFSNATLADVMKVTLEGESLTYIIKDKTIVVRSEERKPEKTITGSTLEFLHIQGQVLSDKGVKLSGATVRVKETGKATQTDFEGNYSFRNVHKGSHLVFNFIGYEQQEVLASEPMQNVILRSSPNRLQEVEVVLSTGYQQLPKERAAGSFGSVAESQLEKRSNMNILSYLEGQVAGVSTGTNGAITIRGQSTIASTSNRNPLIVLDGFPIERSIETINPNDVESITVLKDASAASIWGVRAANGVIVIQTKRGRSSRKPLDIDFTSTFSITPAASIEDLPYASTSSYIDFEKFKVDHKLTMFTNALPRVAISPVIEAYLNNPQEADQFVEPLRAVNSFREFRDLFMHSAMSQQYGLAIAGKGEKSTHRASVNYDKTNAQFRNNGSERLVTDLFEHLTITSKLRAQVGLNYTFSASDANGMGYSDLKNLLPYQRIVGDNGEYIIQPQTFYQQDKENYVKAGFPYNWDYNLKREFENKNNTTINNNVNVIAGLNYEIWKGLSANIGYQYEYSNALNKNMYNEETYFVRNAVNFSSTTKNGVVMSGIPRGGIYAENNANFYSHTYRGMLKYDSSLQDEKHMISAIAGTEIRELGNKASSQTKYGYDPQSLQFARVNYNEYYTDVRGGTQNLIPDESLFVDELNRFVSLYSNAGYTYYSKYTLNASARLDKTNLFGSSDRYKNVWLWSSGVSWQMHKEHFFDNGIFNTLILRATYGINGNVNKATSPFLIANLAINAENNQPYAYVANPSNPMLRWEKTKVTNFGLDFSMLGNRLKGAIEYYDRVSSDLLGNATVNGTYGFNSAFINYASLRNTGVDINLSAQLLNTDFKWQATLNYSYNKNRITKVDFPQKTVGAYLNGIPQEGLPLNYMYSYRWAGLSSKGFPQVYDEKGEVLDYTKEMANPLALVYQGTRVAPHYGALINEFNYQRFSLLTNFTYKMGHKFLVPVIQYSTAYAGASQISEDWDSRWQQPGDEAFTNIPGAPTKISGLGTFDQYTQYADINVETASVIRFRELLLNYRLPVTAFKTYPSSVFTIGLQIRNLASYKLNKAGLDPEFLTTTSQGSTTILPPKPEYSIMLKASF